MPRDMQRPSPDIAQTYVIAKSPAEAIEYILTSGTGGMMADGDLNHAEERIRLLGNPNRPLDSRFYGAKVYLVTVAAIEVCTPAAMSGSGQSEFEEAAALHGDECGPDCPADCDFKASRNG